MTCLDFHFLENDIECKQYSNIDFLYRLTTPKIVDKLIHLIVKLKIVHPSYSIDNIITSKYAYIKYETVLYMCNPLRIRATIQ